MPGVQFDPGAVLDKVMMVTMMVMWIMMTVTVMTMSMMVTVTMMTMSMMVTMMTMRIVLDNVDGDHDDNVDDAGWKR